MGEGAWRKLTPSSKLKILRGREKYKEDSFGNN
jgi:hypothetical protein